MTGCYPTPLGFLRITTCDGAVTGLVFTQSPQVCQGDALCDKAARQVMEYLAGSRREFDFPLHPSGTEFQGKVWQALRDIPYGQTASYKDIACRIGSPAAARAVGSACRRNPIWLAIPCHRVIGSNGSLSGYAGGEELKRQLLELERT